MNTYTPALLARIRTAALIVTLAVYCLWAFGIGATPATLTQGGSLWRQLSILPVATGLRRHTTHLHHRGGGAPEDIVLADRLLQVIGLAWVTLFALGVYI